MDFPSGGFTVITPNAPFIRTGARWHARVPDGRVAMEMHDTFVMSCLFPDGHTRSFEKLDRPFLSICFVQIVARLRVLLALLFCGMAFVPCVV